MMKVYRESRNCNSTGDVSFSGNKFDELTMEGSITDMVNRIKSAAKLCKNFPRAENTAEVW